MSAVEIGGTIYACGGYDGRQRHNSAEKYDQKRNQWTLVKPMYHQRSDAGATCLKGIIVIIIIIIIIIVVVVITITVVAEIIVIFISAKTPLQPTPFIHVALSSLKHYNDNYKRHRCHHHQQEALVYTLDTENYSRNPSS